MTDVARNYQVKLERPGSPGPSINVGWGWLPGLALAILVGFVTLGPVAYVAIQSFNVAPLGAPIVWGLDGWKDVISGQRTLSSISYSIILAGRVPIAIILALGIAWLLVRVNIPYKRFIELSLLFGFFLPSIPMMMGWILLLDPNYGLLNVLAQKLPFVKGPIFSIYSVPGIMWVHLSLTTVPIMTILLTPALRQLDAAYEEAAEMSGASSWIAWRKVILPLIAPAILTAFIAGLIRSLETFEVEQFLGTPSNIYVYATRIFDMIRREPPLLPQAMALSSLFLAILFLLSALYQFYIRRAGTRATLTGKGLRISSRPRIWANLASAALIAYVSISILMPLTMLIAGSLTKIFGFFFLDDPWSTSHWIEVFFDDRFLRATLNSVSLGLSVGVLGVFLFALLAWIIVRSSLWSRELVSFLVWLPWAIPGLVMGVTLLSLLLNTPGLNKLYGTLIPLILALLIKELPIGVQMIRTAIAQTSVELEEAGKMAGGQFHHIFLRISLPLVSPTLISVFLLVFASTVRDISTVVLIAAPGTRTLSLLMFDFAGAGRFEQAAVVGVVISLIALGITAVVFGIGNRRNSVLT